MWYSFNFMNWGQLVHDYILWPFMKALYYMCIFIICIFYQIRYINYLYPLLQGAKELSKWVHILFKAFHLLYIFITLRNCLFYIIYFILDQKAYLILPFPLNIVCLLNCICYLFIVSFSVLRIQISDHEIKFNL